MNDHRRCLTPALGVSFLGVHFYWPKRKPGFDQENLHVFDEPYRQILDSVREPMRRQKRSRLKYWDAMTLFDQHGIPEPLAESYEAQLADRLIGMLSRKRRYTQTIRELTELEALASARTRLAYFSGQAPEEFELVVSRTNPARIEFGSDGRTHMPKPGFFQLIELDMDGVKMASNAIDWYRLLVLALLLQIRADLEIDYETGLQRVRKCEHRRCGAWFLVNRMAGRQRFCSTLCRVTEARDDARGWTTTRRTPKR